MIAVVVINYRHATTTLECLSSLYARAGHPFHLFLVDNAADEESRVALGNFAGRHDHVTLIINDDNRGFAGGCNQALAEVLRDPRFHAVALLNNDTVVETDWLARMARRLDPERRIEMVAGRMVCFDRPEAIDSLGIVLYKSGIASNRKRPVEPLLGPCAGAALYTVSLLEAAREVAGHVFDPDFFCYAEDTDLALRARALGYQCVLADDAVVRHRGSLSSGGGYNEFVAYHGLRNSLFALVKNLPAGFFWRNFGWILLMQGAVMVKYLVKGKPGLLWRIYRDFGSGLPRILGQRQRLWARLGRRWTDWRQIVSPRFYDPDYLRQGLRTLHRRDIRSARL